MSTRNTHNLIRAAFLSGFTNLVQELGGRPDQLLEEVGLTAGVEKDLENFIPFQSFVQLLEVSSTNLNCPDFGLRLSEKQGLPVLGLLSVLAGNLVSIESSFRAISRYMYLQIPSVKLDMQVAQDGQAIRILVSVIAPTSTPLAQFLEFIMGNGQHITHTLAGAKISAQHIFFPHLARSSKSVYQRFFACEVSFAQDFCAVDLPRNLVDKPVKSADGNMAELAEEFFAKKFVTLNMGEVVIHLIHILLPTGQCNIKVVANHLNMHPRTLQRRLAKLELIFETLLDQQRCILATRYLNEPGLALTHIAGLLGYVDQSTLNRSCLRWFNATPNNIRGAKK